MPYPLSQSVIPYQSQILRPLKNQALLSLEMKKGPKSKKVQKVMWSMKQSSVKESFIQHVSGWQSICLLIHRWLVL